MNVFVKNTKGVEWVYTQTSQPELEFISVLSTKEMPKFEIVQGCLLNNLASLKRFFLTIDWQLELKNFLPLRVV